MGTFYLDYVNGNDANDGSNWANAWKTITSGATAARIAPNDLIKIAKSPDPTSLGVTGAFTNKSRTLTLGGAVTANVDMCDAAWTPSANVTFTQETSTSYTKEGTGCVKLAIADAFGTGKIAYKALSGSTDFSGYQQINFWIYITSAVAAGVLKVSLCSDVAGDTPVDEFTIPQINSYNMRPFVINKGSALGATIQSVAIYAISDPGAITLYLDDIFASKATSSADSLSLYSLVGKNDGQWFPVKSVNGTAVYLECDPADSVSNGQGYYGTTETVTCYKRECIDTGYSASSSTHIQEVQDSGTAGNLIDFEGGYNTGSGSQDGQTYFSNQAGYGYGLTLDGKSYIKTRRLSFVRYSRAVYIANTCTNNDLGFDSLVGNGSTPLYINSTAITGNTITVENINNNGYDAIDLYSCYSNIIDITNVFGNQSDGLYASTASYNTITIDKLSYNTNNGLSLNSYSQGNNATLININDNTYNGIQLTGSSDENIVNVTNIANNNTGAGGSSGGIYNSGANLNKVKGATTVGNTRGVYTSSGQVFLYNCDVQESTEVTISASAPDWTCVRSHKHDQSGTDFKTFYLSGVIESELTTRHTASGYAWKMTPSSATKKLRLLYENFKTAVNSGSEVTINVYVRKDGSYNGNAPRLVVVGGIVAGVASDVTDALTVAADNWEQLTVQVTPNEVGVLEFYVDCDGTAGNVFVDDFTITQV